MIYTLLTWLFTWKMWGIKKPTKQTILNFNTPNPHSSENRRRNETERIFCTCSTLNLLWCPEDGVDRSCTQLANLQRAIFAEMPPNKSCVFVYLMVSYRLKKLTRANIAKQNRSSSSSSSAASTSSSYDVWILAFPTLKPVWHSPSSLCKLWHFLSLLKQNKDFLTSMIHHCLRLLLSTWTDWNQKNTLLAREKFCWTCWL